MEEAFLPARATIRLMRQEITPSAPMTEAMAEVKGAVTETAVSLADVRYPQGPRKAQISGIHHTAEIPVLLLIPEAVPDGLAAALEYMAIPVPEVPAMLEACLLSRTRKNIMEQSMRQG